MKYYAVTDDPRELYHYGVKGMKWGQHLFGEDLRPKSPAYKRAASKLRATVKSNKRTSRIKNAARSFSNFAKRSATQLAYNARQRQDQKYQKAVLKAQRQNDLTAMRMPGNDAVNIPRLQPAVYLKAKGNVAHQKRK